MKKLILGVLLFSTLIYGQSELSEEYEKRIERLGEYEEFRHEIEERITYIETLKEVGSDIHDEILIEYKELKEELDRDIKILEMEIKNANA